MSTNTSAEVAGQQGRVRVYLPLSGGEVGWQESTFSLTVDGVVEQKTFSATLPDGSRRQVVITVDVLESDEPVTPGPVYPVYPADDEEPDLGAPRQALEDEYSVSADENQPGDIDGNGDPTLTDEEPT